jgi:cell division septum initiation protein DivIVA
MYTPAELIEDIQKRLDQLVRDYHQLTEKNKKLETENKLLTNSLEEAVKQQEAFTKKLDMIRQDTLREQKGLDQWKIETRKEIRGLMKEVEKCIPQVESMYGKNKI